MQLYEGDRARWPRWLMTALVVACALVWWRHEVGAVAPEAAPVPVIGDSTLPHDVCSASSSEPIASATTAVTAAPALQLKGTVMAGAGSFAMMRRTTDSQLLELRMGDRVDGFVVTAIESDRVVLAGAGRSIVIEADVEAEASNAAAVAPSVAAPLTSAAAVLPVPNLIPIEQLPAAYRGPAPEDEVLGH